VPHDHSWTDQFDDFQQAADALERDTGAHSQDKAVQSEMKILRAEVLDVLFRLRELADRAGAT
jgi:transcription initiation factor IIE alpha subunit